MEEDPFKDAEVVRLYKHECLVDPLIWYEADERKLERRRFPLIPFSDEQSFMNFLCRPRSKNHMKDVMAAYRTITAAEGEHEIRAIIGEPRVVGRLINPLRDAKSAFVVGNYLGTIAMSGLIAETVGILLFEISEAGLDPSVVRSVIDAELPDTAKDRTFEGLSQARRVSVLNKLGLVTSHQTSWLAKIAEIRKRHLHLLSEPMPTEEETLEAFQCALKLIYTVTREPGDTAKLSINEKLSEQLDRQGAIETILDKRPKANPEP